MTVKLAERIEIPRGHTQRLVSNAHLPRSASEKVSDVSLGCEKRGHVLKDDALNAPVNAVLGARSLTSSLGPAYTDAGEHKTVPSFECVTLSRAREHLRTCGELWPDNKLMWCEKCRAHLRYVRRRAMIRRTLPKSD